MVKHRGRLHFFNHTGRFFPSFPLFLTPCSLIVQLSNDYPSIVINNLYHRHIIQFLCTTVLK